MYIYYVRFLIIRHNNGKNRNMSKEKFIFYPLTMAHHTALCAMNQDARVMAFFPSLYNAEETATFIKRVEQHQADYGFSLNALIHNETHKFIGFVGLLNVNFLLPHNLREQPPVEIGWRLAHEFWGYGYAPRAARLCLADAFMRYGLSEVISFTAIQNTRSRRVMEKIGMSTTRADDFDHPKLDKTYPLCRHALYRIQKEEFHP